MSTPHLGSLLLASTDPGRLKAWYQGALGLQADPYGFLHAGSVAVLITGAAG
jgi:hypothetical protein